MSSVATVERVCSDVTAVAPNSKPSINQVITPTNEASQLLASSEDPKAATFPPIQPKTSVISNCSNKEDAKTGQRKQASVAKEASSSSIIEQQIESDKIAKKLNRRRRASRDFVDIESSEVRRLKEKSRRSKRKSKSRPQDFVSSSQGNWPSDQDHSSAGNVVTLPQIDTPDLIRHQGLSNVDSPTQDGANRRKKPTDMSGTRELELLKRIKERPSSSHSQGVPRSGNIKLDSNERKEAFTGVASTSHEQLFKLSLEPSNCCLTCREREDKIKLDYDRMILFSKKDRVCLGLVAHFNLLTDITE